MSSICDEKSFEARLTDEIPRLRAYARKLTRGRDVWEDLVQDTVMLALGARDGFDGKNIGAWLSTILKHRFINVMKTESDRGRLREVVAASACGVWASGHLPRPDARWEGKDVTSALSGMTPEYRDALLAYEVEGMRYKEIALDLGRPVGTVMSRLHRARAALAAAVA